MRILHVIATLAPQAGGPSNSVRRILAAYPNIGSEGEVVTLDDPADAFLRKLTFCVHALGPVSNRFGYTARFLPWLRAHGDRFDGVVVHGLWQYLGYAVRRTMHGRRPYLVFTHGMLDPYFKRANPLKHLKKLPYWLLVENQVLRDAQWVLFTSEGEAANATLSFQRYQWNPCIVPYGATAPAGSPALLIGTFLEQHPRLRCLDGSPRPFLLFLGRIHAKKGCDQLLAAFAKIADRTPNLHLVFAGPDAEPDAVSSSVIARTRPGNLAMSGLKASLIASAENLGVEHRVHWTGMLEGDQKWGAFHACEAFCLPSHQENFGIAVAEALACGKPVLLSDKVEIWREVFNDGAAFVGSDNADGTLQTLESWIALSVEEKKAMSVRAANCFRARYDMETSVSGIIDAFAKSPSPAQASQPSTPRPAFPLSANNSVD